MSDLIERLKVPLSQLRWQLDPESLPFDSTQSLEPSEEIIGQDRAVKAIRMGLELESFGYNIFITGLVGTGRMTVVKRLLAELSSKDRVSNDLCYVHNFRDAEMPRLIRLAAKRGCELKRAMEQLGETLRNEIPQAFETEEYQKQRKAVIEKHRGKQESLINDFQERVKKEGFAVIQVQMGPFSRPDVLPVMDEEPVSLDRLSDLVSEGKLKEKDVARMRERQKVLSEELASVVKETRTIEKALREGVEQLDREMIKRALVEPLRDLRARFEEEPVRKFIDEVEENILDNVDRFKRAGEGEEEKKEESEDPLRFYTVNVIVDNSRSEGPPIIVETNPSFRNLFGTVEQRFAPGVGGKSDFSHVRAGSLLRADGGYLIINAIDALVEPNVWPALKRTLRTGRVTIQPTDSPFFVGMALKPEPVAIQTKVVMIGDAGLYELLYERDEDFMKIFKVKAEFDAIMDRGDAAIDQYARFIAKISKSESLLPFERSAVSQVIEYAVRRAGHQDKLSTHFTYIKDLIVEASYWAAKDEAKGVRAEHVEQALEARNERVNLLEMRIQEAIERDEIIIDTTGTKIGQVNGLAVYRLGDHTFGKPTRITAEIGVGRGGIINVEREASLSGATHDKGILILSGFLRGRFAREKPLTLSASICFEQSYSGVDGDSASSTEIYALLSALSGVPIRQDIAVTGSVDQKGQIQPIGGANEKIEGFFDVCRRRGLTGTQGVMIPRRNIPHLMLREDLLDAVAKGQFSVIAVDTIDEGIEVLMGVPAGERGEDGLYPEGTVNAAVEKRLAELAERVKPFGTEAGGVWT